VYEGGLGNGNDGAALINTSIHKVDAVSGENIIRLRLGSVDVKKRSFRRACAYLTHVARRTKELTPRNSGFTLLPRSLKFTVGVGESHG
jgi:hypothetical protein